MGNNLDVSIRGKTQGLRESLNQAKSDVRAFKSEVSKGGGLGGEIKSLVGTYLGLGALKSVIDYGDQIADLSQRFAVSSDSLQKWGNVAEQNGSSLEGVAGALNKLEIARDKALSGDAEMIAHFKELGVSVDDLKSKDADELLLAIGGSSMHASDMVAVLGKSALSLVPTLEAVASGAAEFGDVMSEATIQQLGAASDTLKSFGNTARVWVGTALAFVADKAREAGALIGMVVNLVSGVNWNDSVKIAGEQLQAIEDARNSVNQQQEPGGRKRRDAEEPEDKAAKSHVDESVRLAEQLADVQEKRAAKERSDLEQIAELQSRQLDLEERITSAQDDSAEQLKLKIEYEENATEIAERQRKIEEDEIATMKKSSELRERIQKIHEETADIRKKSAFEAMTTDEKIAELQSEIQQKTDDAKDADEERTAELGKQRAELENQLAELQKIKAEEDKKALEKKIYRKLMTPAERRDADRDEARRTRAGRAIRKNEENAEATKRKNQRNMPPGAEPEVGKPEVAKPPDFKAALMPTQTTLKSIEGILDNRLKFPKLGGSS